MAVPVQYMYVHVFEHGAGWQTRRITRPHYWLSPSFVRVGVVAVAVLALQWRRNATVCWRSARTASSTTPPPLGTPSARSAPSHCPLLAVQPCSTSSVIASRATRRETPVGVGSVHGTHHSSHSSTASARVKPHDCLIFHVCRSCLSYKHLPTSTPHRPPLPQPHANTFPSASSARQ